MPANKSIKINLLQFFFFSALQLSFYNGFAQQEGPQIRNFGTTSCLDTAPAMPAYYNDVVKITCDTVWVLNNTRFQLMTRAMEYVLRKDPDEGLKVVAQYESSLKSCTENYADLMNKYNLMSEEISKSSHQSIEYMQGVRNDLEKAKSALAKANKDLEDTQKILTKKDKKTRRTHWLFGAGGLGAGLLIGLLIFGG